MNCALLLRQQKTEARCVEMETGHRYRNKHDKLCLPPSQSSESRLCIVFPHKIVKIDLFFAVLRS